MAVEVLSMGNTWLEKKHVGATLNTFKAQNRIYITQLK